MKYCPNCGDVYPEQAAVCHAHGTALHTWGGATDVTDITHTDVDVSAVPDAPFDPGADAYSGSGSLPVHNEHTAPLRTPGPSIIVDSSLAQSVPAAHRILSDRYHLQDQIGIGGYGAVFSAVDEQTSSRVAIKILSPALSNEYEVLERFRREAIAASMVRHPGIVEVTDVGVDASGLHFIVMEYLDGGDLRELLRPGPPLEPARAIDIALQCANALAAAHNAGILHRDLKPANIFVTSGPGNHDSVKIIDFGVSKITRRPDVATDLTSASKVVGTPMYMAPEQARGEELDGRVDVYALGIILYEMLTGTPPFAGASALEILEQHIHAKRVPPSRVNRELVKPPVLDRAVLKAIAAKSADRHESMAAFAAALSECMTAIAAITPTIPLDVVPTAGEETLVVAPLPLPLRAAADASDPSGEATRVMSVSRERPRTTAYALASVMLVAAAVAVWFAATAGGGDAGRDSPATKPVPAPAPAPTAAAPAPDPATAAPDASIAVAEAEPAVPAVEQAPTADEPDASPPPASKPKRSRKPARRKKRRPPREDPIGIQEW